jgi:hypothetical protein
MFDLESYTLEETRKIECEECGDVGEITSIAKSGETFAGIHVGKKSGESAWSPTNTGWECPSCANAQD